MELFLNLAWLVLSASLIAGYIICAHVAVRRRRWTIVVALTLLVIVLLPAISMTDDLAAINNPAETDHLLRRDQTPLHLHWDVAGVAIVPLVIEIAAAKVAQSANESLQDESLPSLLLGSGTRAFGVRPPPAVTAAAA